MAELEEVIDKLKAELAAWRRRALEAEAEQRELGEGHNAVASRKRIKELESTNQDLNRRVTVARERVGGLMDRLRFLEDQISVDEQTQ